MKVHLKNVRAGFAHQLFTPSAFEEGQTLKYGADLLLVPGSEVYKIVTDPNDPKKRQFVKTTMDAVMLEVANEAWKGKGAQVLASLEPSKKCHRNGDTRVNKDGDPYEGYEGVWYVAAKNKRRPTILDRNKEVLTEADGRPYSGCYVTASIDVYAMIDSKKRGVHASLAGVQFVKDGDAFGGGAPASPDEFDDLGVPEEGESALV